MRPNWCRATTGERTRLDRARSGCSRPTTALRVCVRYKSVRDKYCIYLEQLADTAGVVTWTMEMRMRSGAGQPCQPDPRSVPRTLTPIAASVTGLNTVKLEVHGTQYTASLNGVMVFQFNDPGNLVDAGGVALATSPTGAWPELDDVHFFSFRF